MWLLLNSGLRCGILPPSRRYNSRLIISGFSMSQQQPPKIEFPCENYPIKVLGEAGPELHTYVVEIMERHAPGFDQARITVRESSKGRYHSVTVWITATGVEQLTAIHEDLRVNRNIKMVM
jgi:putative lipoic acid-binding regulatory protein